MAALPTGNNASMDRFNEQLRANPQYRAFLQSMGVNPDRPIRLSGSQRSQAERFVRQLYPQLGGQFQIDPAGNTNTDHGLSTAWSNPYFRYPLIAGATAATLGAAGVFSGAAGAAGAAGGAGGVLPSSSLSGGLFNAAAGIGTAGSTAGTVAGTVGAGVAAGAGGGGGFFSSLSSAGARELIGLGGNLVGGYLQNRAAGNAAEIQDRYLREAMEFERERDARLNAQYLEERNRLWGREEARDGRLAPFRANGGQAYQRLSGLLTSPEAYVSPNPSIPQRPSLANLL